MPLGAHPSSPAVGSQEVSGRRVAQDGRRGLRGKNGSFPPSKSRKPQCTILRGGETPPVATFIVIQPEFLFEFLVVALNHPAVPADSHQPFQQRVSPAKRANQYPLGSPAPAGHSISNHCSGWMPPLWSDGLTRRAARKANLYHGPLYRHLHVGCLVHLMTCLGRRTKLLGWRLFTIATCK